MAAHRSRVQAEHGAPHACPDRVRWRRDQPEIQSQAKGDDGLLLVVCAVRSTRAWQASELAVQIGGTMTAIFPLTVRNFTNLYVLLLSSIVVPCRPRRGRRWAGACPCTALPAGVILSSS